MCLRKRQVVLVVPNSDGIRQITGGNHVKDYNLTCSGSLCEALFLKPNARLLIGSMSKIGADPVHILVVWIGPTPAL